MTPVVHHHPDGDNTVAGVRNLTQVEAAERARLLDVTAYDITLDLTDGTGGPGEGTFRSRHRGPVHLRRAGRLTFIEVAADAVRSADAQRRRGRHSAAGPPRRA